MINVSDSPFAVMTAVVAPAVLTNASSVLCLGTSNRLARVVDRTRVVISEIRQIATNSPEYRDHLKQLDRLRTRGKLLIMALRLLYGALGGYAGAALLTVIGAVAMYYGRHSLFEWFAVAAMGLGILAVFGMASGCVLMIRETTLAITSVSEEVNEAFNELQAKQT